MFDSLCQMADGTPNGLQRFWDYYQYRPPTSVLTEYQGALSDKAGRQAPVLPRWPGRACRT